MKFSTIDFYKEICDSFLEISERLDSIECNITELQKRNQFIINKDKKEQNLMTIAIMCRSCEKTIFYPPQRIYDGGICWSCEKNENP